MGRVLRVVGWAVIAVLAIASMASAHAILVAAQPKANSTVQGPEIPIQLRFNARIDAGRSHLTLLAPDKSETTLELAAADPAAPAVLTSTAKGLKPGAYRLRWQVLATDGHITRGEVPFRVQ